MELSANIDIVPEWLRLKAVYTHLEAYDVTPDPVTGLVDDKRLPRRPRDEARLGFILTPVRGLSIEPTVVLVGSRFSSSGERDKLDPYARLDIYADYRINETFSVFARAENVTDTRYEEISGYGTAGRSFYGGLRATW